MADKKSVLITGCSEGGLGDALAHTFHEKGFRVLASARNPKKMAHFAELGIETIVLDVQSQESINSAVQKVTELTGGTLNILVNNSGIVYMMPVIDADMSKIREVFDVNVFSVISVTQAFVPLLRRAGPGSIIANNSSIASILTVPTQGVYSATKAAVSSINDALRVELAPLGIRTIELKTGSVRTNIFKNEAKASPEGVQKLPPNTIYEVGRDAIEKSMSGEEIMSDAADAYVWAREVVADLTRTKPPAIVWRGKYAWIMWAFKKFLPHTLLDTLGAQKTGFSEFEKRLKAQKS